MRFAFIRLFAILPFALCPLHADDVVYVDIQGQPGDPMCIKFLGGTHDCSGTNSSCMTNQQIWDANMTFGDPCGSYSQYSQNAWLDKLAWTTSGGYDFASAGGIDYYHCKTIGDCKVVNIFGARVCMALNNTQTYVQWVSLNTDMPCPD